MNTYAAVVVTFNRLALLKGCIDSLRKQTKPLDAIIVINNSSTDGTQQWLDAQTDLIVFHQENGGGAAGFYRGMKEAYVRNYDWIWMMDDDVDPLLNCLEEMISSNAQYQNQFDVLQPDRKFFNSESEWRYGSKFNFRNPFMPEATIPVKSSDFRDKEKIKTIVSFPFEGPMFSRKVIEKVGWVDKRYFIFYDDTDYSARVYNAGFKVGFVRDAIMTKMINPPVNGISVDWKLYYRIRNQIIIDRKFGNTYIAISRAAFTNMQRVLAIGKLSLRKKTFSAFPEHVSTVAKAMRDGFKFKLVE
jgi:GT2 family glycosyltransferase